MKVVLAFMQKHWDDLSEEMVEVDEDEEEFRSALKDLAWLPSVQDEKTFLGLRKPEDRWYKPGELFPSSQGHRVCSQAILLEGLEPTGQIQTDLGIQRMPSLDIVTRHFDQLREIWKEKRSVDLAKLTTSLKQIYIFFGQKNKTQPGLTPSGPMLQARYGIEPCIWDNAGKRFVRPTDCFAEKVPFFEPHKIFVGGEKLILDGLDALGRRERPLLDDYVDFLHLLSTFKGDKKCNDQEVEQAIHALEFISKEPDHQVDYSLPVLTASSRLVPLSDVYEDDAPHLLERRDSTDINIIHSRVASRIRKHATPLSSAVCEKLDITPVISLDREIGEKCRQLSLLIHSKEFSEGLRRLAAHSHPWGADEFTLDFGKLSLKPADSICTSLYLDDPVSGEKRIGGGNAAFFVDKENATIWIATASPRRFVIALARAIDSLAGEYRGLDSAALEDILRTQRKEAIKDILDERQIRTVDEAPHPTVDWANFGETGHGNDEFPDKDGSGQDDADADSNPESTDEEPAEVAGSSGGTSGTRKGEAAEPNRPSDDETGTDENGRIAGNSPNGGLRHRVRQTNSNSRGSSSGARAGSDESPPTDPGTGSATRSGASGEGSQESGLGKKKEGGSSSPRPRYYTYVSPGTETGADSGDEEDSEHAIEIGKLAVNRVLEFERSEGRTPRSMPHSHPGFDVESNKPGEDTRYIEVKGIDGSWGAAGVTVSNRQFAFASSKGDLCWLYVVEHVRDVARAKIYPINDPARKVTYFCYDAGWRAVSEMEATAIDQDQPVPGDEVALLDGEIVEVTRVEMRGQIVRLFVKSNDGVPSEVTWLPSMKVLRKNEP